MTENDERKKRQTTVTTRAQNAADMTTRMVCGGLSGMIAKVDEKNKTLNLFFFLMLCRELYNIIINWKKDFCPRFRDETHLRLSHLLSHKKLNIHLQ